MDIKIVRVWRHTNETNKIHYMLSTNGEQRHLWTSEDSALGRVFAGQINN